MEDLVKSIKVDVSNLKNEESFKEVSSYVQSGWNLKAVIPVTDDNKPNLLFIVEKSKHNKLLYVFLSLWVLTHLLISVLT